MASREVVLVWADGYGLWHASVPDRPNILFESPAAEAADAIKRAMLERGECAEDYEVAVGFTGTTVTGAENYVELPDADG